MVIAYSYSISVIDNPKPSKPCPSGGSIITKPLKKNSKEATSGLHNVKMMARTMKATST